MGEQVVPASRARRTPLERQEAAASAAQVRAAEQRVAARTGWRSPPVLVAAALAAVLSCDVVVLAQRQADLAADRGVGRQVAVEPVVAFVPLPVRLTIPDLDVDTRLIGLRKERSGALQVPEDPARAGWYSQGVAPGGDGPAVIVGHVDSYRGPGIFAGLRALRAGQRISVRREDGSTAVFAVESVETFAKRDFPTERVYRGDGRPALRLVTCGGEFDRRAKSYVSNVVVFAVPVDAPPAARTSA